MLRALTCAAALLCSAQAGAQTFEPAMAAWQFQIERMISGLKVETLQESTSAAQQATVSRVTDMGLAAAIVETEARIAVHEALRTFESMQTAIAGLCADVTVASEIELATTATTNVRDALSSIEEGWNTDGVDRLDIITSLQQARETALCSPAEAARGLCAPDAGDYVGGFPAGNSDARTFMLRGQYGLRGYGTSEAEMGMMFMDTILPPATIKSQADAEEEGLSGLLERVEARHQQALISIGRNTVSGVVLRGLEGGVTE